MSAGNFSVDAANGSRASTEKIPFNGPSNDRNQVVDIMRERLLPIFGFTGIITRRPPARISD